MYGNYDKYWVKFSTKKSNVSYDYISMVTIHLLKMLSLPLYRKRAFLS